MSRSVHWLLQEEPTREGYRLCDCPSTARNAPHSIVLRPIFRQQRGGRLRECARCAKIGKELGIP